MNQGHLPDNRDANKRTMKFLGTIKLTVQLDFYRVKDSFFVCNSLATQMILWTEFRDKFAGATWPYEKAV